MANILSINERQNRESDFIREYVENGGNATAAARAIGISNVSASTVGHRMKMRLMHQIEEEQRDSLIGYAVNAIHYLQYLMEHAKSESVRLGAIKEILDRAGLKPINRQEILYVNEFETWTDEELQAEWERLQATN